MIIKNKKNTKKIIISVAIALSFIIISVAILEKLHIIDIIKSPSSQQNDTVKQNSTKIDNNQATEEQIKNGNGTKTGSNSDSPSEPTIIEGSDKKNVQLTISAVNQINQLLQIRIIVGAIESGGQCSLILTNGDNTIKKTVGVQSQATTSTCMGFDIPLSELSSGTWSITVSYSSDNLTGVVNQDYRVVK